MPLTSWWDEHPDLIAGASMGGALAGPGPGAGSANLDLGAMSGTGGFAGPAGGGPMAPEGPGAGGPAPPAFDPRQQVGHNGSINGMNREQYRDAWMGSGVNSVQGAKDWIGKNGGSWMADNGTIMTPFGEALDMGFNARGSAAGNGEFKPSWGGGGGPAGPGAGGAPIGDPGPGGGFVGGNGWTGAGMSSSTARPSYTGEDFKAQTIAGPTEYAPQATQGPDAFTPERIRADQVRGPAPINAERIADANGFTGPTEADLRADPSYKFRLSESLNALQSSAAAKGALRSGNTLDALTARAGQMASDEYGNVYARKSDEYKTGLQDRFQVGQANNANAFQAYDLSNRFDQNAQLANQGANLQASGQNANNSLAAWQAYQGMNQNNRQFNAARTDTATQQNFANRFSVDQANNSNSLAAWQGNVNAKLGFGNLDLGYTRAGNDFSLGQGNLALGNKSADQSYDLGLRNNALGYTQAGNSYSLGLGQQNLGWANYGLNADQQDFGQRFSLADMGLRAAGQQGNYAGQYGTNAANNAIGAGNAQAAGRVGSANAWNNGFTGAANAVTDMYGNYLSGRS